MITKPETAFQPLQRPLLITSPAFLNASPTFLAPFLILFPSDFAADFSFPRRFCRRSEARATALYRPTLFPTVAAFQKSSSQTSDRRKRRRRRALHETLSAACLHFSFQSHALALTSSSFLRFSATEFLALSNFAAPSLAHAVTCSMTLSINLVNVDMSKSALMAKSRRALIEALNMKLARKMKKSALKSICQLSGVIEIFALTWNTRTLTKAWSSRPIAIGFAYSKLKSSFGPRFGSFLL